MTPDRDVVAASQALDPPYPEHAAPARDDDAALLYQEINERRARIENAELLRHLRGL